MKRLMLTRLFLLLLIASASGFAMAEPVNYSSGLDVTLSSQTLSTAAAGRDISLNNVVVEGKLAAGRNISCQGCTISGSVSAGRDVLLERCPQVYSISSGRNAELRQIQVLNQVSSGNDITLQDVTVETGLQAGNQVHAGNSTIHGSLSLGGHYAKLDHSTAAEVRFIENGSVFNGTGNHITSMVSTGNLVNGNVTISRGGSSYVHVGPGSLSSVNGYAIKGAANQTTIITPEQAIYVNGRKVSGDGPVQYEQYRAQHPGAPVVQGPGWAAGQTTDLADAKTGKSDSKVPVNVLELTNNSVIHGPVVFESGYGKVVVYPGSTFNGKVVNGTVEHLSAQTTENAVQ